MDSLFDNGLIGSDKEYSLVIGQVVNNKHKNKINAVQVKILGFNHETKSDTDFPWARVAPGLMISGKDDNTGIFSLPSKGSYVYIMFLYGDVDHPVVIGLAPTAKDGSEEFKGKPSKKFNKIREDNLLDKEEKPAVGEYPHIAAIEGVKYSFILDDTPDAPQIKFGLASGDYGEIRKGLIQFRSTGNFNLFSDSKMYFYSASGYHIKTGGEMIIEATKLTIKCPVKVESTINADQDIVSKTEVKAGIIKLTTHGHSGVKSGPDISGPPTP